MPSSKGTEQWVVSRDNESTKFILLVITDTHTHIHIFVNFYKQILFNGGREHLVVRKSPNLPNLMN